MTRWLNGALARIEADYQRSADTHLIPLPLPAFASHGIDLYLKDESTHPTGTNLVGMLALAREMQSRGEQGAILSLLCDAGERYLSSYFDTAWVTEHIGDCAPARASLQAQLSYAA